VLNLISLNAATALTQRSKRTLWRRLEDGTLARGPDDAQGRTMVDLHALLPFMVAPLNENDLRGIQTADAGDALAQTDAAVLFLQAGRPLAALYWLELAAKQDQAEAMYWLGRLHFDETLSASGVPQDFNVGMIWLAKAAAQRHCIATAQMQALRAKFDFSSSVTA
jgi:uncharacterized protein